MQEAFLHYLWLHKKMPITKLKTTLGLPISIINSGQHNALSGPDFFAAQVKIDNQHWAGNIEIHIKSSDWYVHNHETDPAYYNVILHVVWDHDTDVFRQDNTAIPTLELREYIDTTLLANYYKLFSKKQTWINCEKAFHEPTQFLINNWLERLYIERLERKATTISTLLKQSKNNWEAVLFIMLAKNFGLNINGEAFYTLAQSINFSIIRKLQNNVQQLEALLMGQGGLLRANSQEPYENNLFNTYQYLKTKYNLDNTHVLPVQFFKLRPPNFPTIRLSQLASIYAQNHGLLSRLIQAKTLPEFYDIFQVGCTAFWQTHYTFQTPSKASKKMLTKSFINLVIINTVVPITFSYAKAQGQDNTAEILNVMAQVPSEKNQIVSRFHTLRPLAKTAAVSQALIQLKQHYCVPNKCLECAIGNNLISK
ncbi:DUF2851 family protein [Bizionia sediminis]|uniref:DUF2851 family protein n=1 Tax=Bizionia sediminis TaxID=1737064 RepID=A0ABW5KU15_9FLAO